MQVVDKTRIVLDVRKISDKEVMLLSEIGLDEIGAATDYVEYISEKYGLSQSGVWYTLKKLKRVGMLQFTERGESYRPLMLTEGGRNVLRGRMGAEGGAGDYMIKRLAQISV